MKKIRILYLAVIVLIMFMAINVHAATNVPPQTGSSLPEMNLLKPTAPADLKYLGLSGSGTFTVDQVAAQVVIIQIFSMYCPYCQNDAPNVNRLFSLMENNPSLKGKIKIIGVGVGNSQFEVNTFKKKYSVEFPLIPDGDFKIHKIVGEVRTPYFIVVKLKSGAKTDVIYSRLGAQENIEAFLGQIVQSAGIK
jgi:thiol-disulfide isomerase/thioredoxin